MALTRGNSVASFFRCLHHTKGAAAGTPFALEPWQREFVDEFYRVDEAGDRVYRLGILGVPRGNGKSPMAAGFGLYELMSRKDSPDVFAASGSKDQAQVLMDFAKAFVETGPLRDHIKPHRRSMVSHFNSGVMRVLASEGALQHGLNPSTVIVDELHAFMTDSQEELWTALWTALHKRPNSFALVITTAGFDKQTLLGRMYDAALEMPDREDRPGLRIRRDLENGVLFWWYGLAEGEADDWRNEELWKLVNPASWVTVGGLRKQLNAPGSDELDFVRLHLNAWTKARDSWLPAGVWSGLADADVKIPRAAKIYAGVDVGWTHDSTAVAWAHKAPDGLVVLRAKVWTTDEGAEGEFVEGGKMRLELVEEFLRKLARKYKLVQVGYDPKFFGRSAEDLERERLTMVEMLPSSAPMQNAWQAFYQACMEGKLVHDGDEVLAGHVEAAAATKTETGWKVRKLRSTSRIDALAAAVMAFERCVTTETKGKSPRIFWLDD